MRSQREVDRDAAVAILKRDDDVTPQIAIRERACEEDERGPSTGRSPGQGSKPSFRAFPIPCDVRSWRDCSAGE
jgi:hypothetical protein